MAYVWFVLWPQLHRGRVMSLVGRLTRVIAFGVTNIVLVVLVIPALVRAVAIDRSFCCRWLRRLGVSARRFRRSKWKPPASIAVLSRTDDERPILPDPEGVAGCDYRHAELVCEMLSDALRVLS